MVQPHVLGFYHFLVYEQKDSSLTVDLGLVSRFIPSLISTEDNLCLLVVPSDYKVKSMVF